MNELPHGVIASDPALDAGERGNPVLLLETWGLDRHVAPLLAMTYFSFVSLQITSWGRWYEVADP